ncbi:MAG: hypothetical protein HY094_07255 [Candidatus Melainabacteria bacterium]|nr:hypothetical protein [Candidatus Melainabacteria bacterium]
MKNTCKFCFCLIISISTLLLSFLSVHAQTIEVNSMQTLSIPGPGFFPFSTTGNNQIKGLIPNNPEVTVTFSNFLGSPCTLAPAADFAEIGPKVLVSGNGTFILDFSMIEQNTSALGLSLVPQGGTSFFDIFVTPPEVSSTSSSGGNTISGNIFPNGVSIFGGFVGDDLLGQLSNEPNNPGCQSSPSGINPTNLSNEAFITNLYNDLLKRPVTPQRKFRSISVKPGESDFEAYTLTIPENKNSSMTVYNTKLINNTDMTKIYVTGIFPSLSEENTTMLGRTLSPEIEVTLKEQTGGDLIALAAVQHAIISATMPWQLGGGGFFITKGGGCVGPYCTIVEAGMVVIVPGGACTPEKLNKRKAGYPTVNPSKFFDPFPNAQGVIQIPTSNITDPKHPFVSRFVKDKAYLILQPVPPKSNFIQQLKLDIKKP